MEAWTRRRTSAQALALRSRIVLLAAEGSRTPRSPSGSGSARRRCRKWRKRFAEQRLDGLTDEPRPGQPRKITDAQVEEVIVKTLETTPKDATHWSTRSMAAEVGLNQTAVHADLAGVRAPAAPPGRRGSSRRTRSSSRRSATSSGCISTRPSARSCLRRREVPDPGARSHRADPADAARGARARDARLQARRDLEPLRRAEHHHRQGHRRAAQPPPRDRVQEVPADASTARSPPSSTSTSCSTTASTHKTPAIQRWLAAHPRFVLHFTPTATRWLNLVERWFAELTTKKLAPRRAPLRPRAQRRHPRLDRDLERQPQALRLDQDRRPDPRLNRPLLAANQRITTLGGP